MKNFLLAGLSFAMFSLASCGGHDTAPQPTTTKTNTMDASAAVSSQEVQYSADGVTMHGFVAFDSAVKGPRPIVVVVPEWWGITDYPKTRAKQLAALGYFAIAADIYGEGKIAADPAEAQKLSGEFYGSVAKQQQRFDAAVAKAKTYPEADSSRVAAIGYCFGGGIVLNMARIGEPLKGVVSFHGSLLGAPADKKLLTAKILVCHGDSDKFVSPQDVAAFKKQMDSIGADYKFVSYPNATHAFTNPASTENGKKFNMPIAYNAAADTASWKEMQDFFHRIFK